MDNIRTVLMDMPGTIRAYTIFKDDFYTIVINSALNLEMQRIAYYHELLHIKSDDFNNQNKIGMIELHAHQI